MMSPTSAVKTAATAQRVVHADPSCDIAAGLAANNPRAGQARLVVDPSMGRVGSEITIEGTGFPPLQDLEIQVGRPGTDVVITVGRTMTDVGGALRARTVVPESPLFELPQSPSDRRCLSVSVFGGNPDATSELRLIGAVASFELESR